MYSARLHSSLPASEKKVGLIRAVARLRIANSQRENKMPHYENVFIARQDVSATQVDALADAYSEIITAGGGTIHRREYWGLKSLAYRIKKNRKGHFVLLNIEAPSDTVREMERNMGLSEDVLRHLTIRMDEAPEGPSVMMQGRGERERATRDGDGRPAPRAEASGPEKASGKEKIPAGDEKPAKEVADAKPTKEVADAKPTKEVADAKPAEEVADAKPIKEVADAKPTKEVADAKPAEEGDKQ